VIQSNSISIGFLADHPETIPTLANWFRDQWPDYYADRSPAEMEQGFLKDASRDHLPCRLVAFDAGELAGTIVLREDGTEALPEFQPELGGLFVLGPHRGRGIATELVRAGMEIARDDGFEQVYATTVVAAGILKYLGWEYVRQVIHKDGELSLYQCSLCS
jgi:GNAT superfamily N-acetyltransferase